MNNDWVGTRHLVIVPIVPTGKADPMRGIVGNETGRIVGHVFVARGEYRPMSVAGRKARATFGPTAEVSNGEFVYAGDPIATKGYSVAGFNESESGR